MLAAVEDPVDSRYEAAGLDVADMRVLQAWLAEELVEHSAQLAAADPLLPQEPAPGTVALEYQREPVEGWWYRKGVEPGAAVAVDEDRARCRQRGGVREGLVGEQDPVFLAFAERFQAGPAGAVSGGAFDMRRCWLAPTAGGAISSISRWR